MVAIETEIDPCQAARIVRWLGGERAVDVPAEFGLDHSSAKEDFVDDQIVSSNVECIELLRLQALNKQGTTTFERSSLLGRLSQDNSSLSTTTPIFMDELYTTLDRRPIPKNKIDDDDDRTEDMSLLREIAQATPHILPMIIDHHDRSIEVLREMMIKSGTDEGDFETMVKEFVQLIKKKLSDSQITLFNDTSSSPSLFDMLNDLKTCLTLLGRTEMQSLLQVFDTILKQHVYPSRLPDPAENNEELLKLSQYAIDELKFVKIEKSHQPLGLTISRAESGTIHIARIVVGGIAASTELFQIDDRILEINDEPITGRSLDHVCTLMSNTTGLIKFLLAPPTSHNQVSYQTFYVRALYAYDPRHDPLIPCPELGLTFQRGDILRIVAYDESLTKTSDGSVSWWQAYREISEESTTDPSLAGLVPSDSLQQKRADLLKVISDDAESVSSAVINHKSLRKIKLGSTCFTCVSAKQQHQRKPLQLVYNNVSFVRDVDDKEAPTIRRSTNHFSLTDTRQLGEEPSSTIKRKVSDRQQTEKTIDVFRFYERVFRLDLTAKQMTRPIVLIGAPNVGRHELRRRLLQSAPDLFDIAVPHTTRPARAQEIADVDYHFVTEQTFLAKIAAHSFVEFGQYDRDLYGTSIDDVRQVVQNRRKICILNLNPDAIRAFYQSDLYPYVICIAAPAFERLKRLELDRREQLTEKDYREILRQSRSIERHHRLLFDYTIINNDFERTFLELHDLIIRIQHEHHQWARACYVLSS